MKKITSILMFLAFSLCVCGMFVAPAAAQEEEVKVIDCRYDEDCDNGLDKYCSSIPKCLKECAEWDKGSSTCALERRFGECVFQDPCRIYDDKPNCDVILDTCVECWRDEQCDGVCLDSVCVECVDDDDCSSDAVCENNECIECDSNDDCDENSDGDFCVEGSCEECVVDEDCPQVWETCDENNECVGDAECTADSDCIDSDAPYPDTFCAPYQFCNKAAGVCDNSSNVCEVIWGMPASACVEEDRKCTACLYNGGDGSGDVTCQDTWEDLASGNGYPVPANQITNDSPDYSRYTDGVFDNATGAVCTAGGDCVECIVDEDCPGSFCNGTEICVAGLCEVEVPSFNPCASETTPDLCDEDGARCVDCLSVSDCPETLNFCNGTRTCDAAGNGECGFSGNPCPRTCLPDSEKCDDCKSDADCVAGDNPGDDFEGKPICQTSNEFDEDTNSCTECKQDSDCGADQVCDLDVEYDYSGVVVGNNSKCADCLVDEDCAEGEVCVDGECDECRENADCPADMPRCRIDNAPVDDDNGQEADFQIIQKPMPESGGDYCGGVAPAEDNVCVECFFPEDCPEETPHCLVDTCQQFGGPPYGAPNAAIIGEMANICVECRDDNDCQRDLYGPDACLRDGVCDNESFTCSWTNPCGDMQCYPAGYYEEAGRQNITWRELGPAHRTFFCTDCLNDASCDDGQFCNGAETCLDTEGVCEAASAGPCAEGQLCDEASDACLDVECLEDTDCLFFETCDSSNECQAEAATCGMKITPKKVKADKIVDGKQKLTIKGIKGQSFDPNAEIYFSDPAIVEPSGSVTVKKDKRKSLLEAVGVIDEGTILTIRLGDCEGTVEVK